MKLSDQLWLSFHNLMLHKIRSVLTSLGIIFGVGSVIAMLSISEGAKREALAQIESMGVDKIIVSTRKPPPTGKDVSENTTNSNLETFGLTQADHDHILHMDNVKSIATARNSRKSILRGTTQLDLSLFGVTLDFLEESRSEITQGRWLSPLDKDRNVCVLGIDAKRALFSLAERDIIGKVISVGDDAFRLFFEFVRDGIAEHERVDVYGQLNARIGGKALFDPVGEVVRLGDGEGGAYFHVNGGVHFVLSVVVDDQVVDALHSVEGEDALFDVIHRLFVGRSAQQTGDGVFEDGKSRKVKAMNRATAIPSHPSRSTFAKRETMAETSTRNVATVSEMLSAAVASSASEERRLPRFLFKKNINSLTATEMSSTPIRR